MLDPWQGQAETTLKVASIGYTKGMARSCSLLAFLYWCKEASVDLAARHEQLWKSILTIYVQHKKHESRVEEALDNMKISLKGDVRRKASLPQQALIIVRLSHYGFNDNAGFVRKWNQTSPRHAHIVGKRAVALKFLFEHTEIDTLMLILRHCGDVGWDDSVWLEDALASKKLYARHQFPSKHKKWLPRLLVTHDSMRLCIEKCQQQHIAASKYMRRKMEVGRVEIMSERAAAIYHIGEEVTQNSPISKLLVKERWTDAWVAGADHIDIEIQGALVDKSPEFNPLKDICTFRTLLDEHQQTAPIQGAPPVNESELAADTFSLVMKQLDYNLKVWGTWQRKCSTVKSTRYFAEQEWRLQRVKRCRAAAEKLVALNVKLIPIEDMETSAIIGAVMSFKKEIASRHVMNSSDIPCLVYKNMTTGMNPRALHAAGDEVMAWSLMENTNSVGAALMPVFGYSPGKLHLDETAALEALTKANHNIDISFYLNFEKKIDMRDVLRPLVIPGKLVFPSTLVDLKKKSPLFYKSELCLYRRTRDCKMVPVKELKEIEDLNPGALPPSTDSRDSRIHGAAKVLQVGVDACLAILEGLLATPALISFRNLLVIDTNTGVGDMIEAFLQVRRSFGVSMHFCGLCLDQCEVTWNLNNIETILAAQFLEEKKLPSGEVS